MNTTDEIAKALRGEESHATLYWDRQENDNEGPAYRIITDDTAESGGLELNGWAYLDGELIPEDGEGRNVRDYFRGPDSTYLGPDSDGVYPVLL